ncbi:MAG: glucose-6-phosphate isomerase [Candidatus Nanopelagicales bacterium]
MTTNPLQTTAGQKLSGHHDLLRDQHLRSLLRQPGRVAALTIPVGDLVVDFTRIRGDSTTLDLLASLADELQIPAQLAAMTHGDRVNTTEGRPALHTATRLPTGSSLLVDGHDVAADVASVNAQMATFVDSIHGGQWLGATGQPIRNVVNIGIGGSDLGPRMVVRALRRYWHAGLNVQFVSNVDPADLAAVLSQLDPATTLFVVVSKTFTTTETLANAETAKRWLVSSLGEQAPAKHLVAVTAATDRAREFGVQPSAIFGFWDWVGGRFSLASPVGLAIELAIGPANMRALRAGMHLVDRALVAQPTRANASIILGMLDVWYSNYHSVQSKAVIPYAQDLQLFSAHLQQVQMESNGKSVAADGSPIDWTTSASLWGTPGTNGQHAFFQLLHQGTDLIPIDFIGIVEHEDDERARMLQANLVAQASALAVGRLADELASDGVDPALIPHRVMPGNHPSTLITLPRLDPHCLGELIALYEHATVVAGLAWQINPFDQWGVELGKQLASQLLPAVSGGPIPADTDAATLATISRLREPSP